LIVVATHVTATDLATGEQETTQFVDNYVLIREGSAHVDSVVVHRKKDGTITHVITVKGIKP